MEGRVWGGAATLHPETRLANHTPNPPRSPLGILSGRSIGARPDGDGFILHTVNMNGNPRDAELFGFHEDMHGPKCDMADLRNQGLTSNDGFKTVQRKASLVNTRKKAVAPPRYGRNADSPKRNVVFSPETKIHYFDRDDMDFDDIEQVVVETEHGNASGEMVNGFLWLWHFL
ncbi:hypothetical protein Tco_0352875 [Tanacetum coccineum]